ncbi:hypothetical protein [Paenibacillus caui]|uniref:DUF6060 domain-containing protein n=1 Tax=Paenibacillus caui TaxID=2873927 RepID=UPI001CA9F202|nr:hypothetical protein [Paenibacillus caui]
MKKFVAIVLSICMLLGASSIVSAKEDKPTNDKKNAITVDQYGYYDPTTGLVIGAAFNVDENGNLVEIPLEEYAKEAQGTKPQAITQKDIPAQSGTVSPMVFPYEEHDEFLPESYYQYYAAAQPVSDYIWCNSDVGCPITAQWQVTSQNSFTANVNTNSEKSAVMAGAGYNYSYSTSESISYSLTVPKGKKALLAFRPKYTHVQGKLKHTNNLGIVSYKDVGTEYPVKNSQGNTAGTFLLVYAN